MSGSVQITPLRPVESWRLGEAWAGNTANAVPYRGASIIPEGEGKYITAFYDAEGRIAVHRVHSGRAASQSAIIESPRLPFDAHQAISLGRDSLGKLQLAFGAHSGSVLFCAARQPDFMDGFCPIETFGREARYTYPFFLDGSRMIVRSGTAASADLFLAHAGANTTEWQVEEQPIIAGRCTAGWSAGPYLNTPVRGPDGRWHLFIVWRLPPDAAGGNPVVNVGIDYASINPDFSGLETGDGRALALPLSPVTVDRCVAVGPWRTLMNQCSAAIRPNGAPIATSYWADADGVPQYRLIHRDGEGQWTSTRASDFKTSFTLDGVGTLPLPHSRPEILVTPNDVAALVYRSAEFGNGLVLSVYYPPYFRCADATNYLLVDEDLGYYEPVIARDAARTGDLIIYVQRCNQLANRDQRFAQVSAPAWLGRWRLPERRT